MNTRNIRFKALASSHMAKKTRPENRPIPPGSSGFRPGILQGSVAQEISWKAAAPRRPLSSQNEFQ